MASRTPSLTLTDVGLLLLGLGTRLFGLLFAGEMAGAIWFVHGRNGFFLPNGFEFAMTLGLVSLAPLLIGPGSASIDGAISLKRMRHDVLPPPVREDELAHAGRS